MKSDFSLTQLIKGTGVLLLFMPKVNLISFEGQTAGIRVDDILLLLIMFVFIVEFCMHKKNIFTPAELILFIMVGLYIISNLINISFFKRSNPLYTIRYIEYFTFFYIGCYSLRRLSLKRLAQALLLANGLVMLLQRFGLIGAFSSLGVIDNASDRVLGLTGGPWEIGIILNFILVILLYNQDEGPITIQTALFYFFTTFFLLLFTGARMPTMAHLLIATHFLYSRIQSKRIFFILSVAFLLLLILFTTLIENPLLERSTNLLTLNNVTILIEYYNQLTIDVQAIAFPELPANDGASDASWLFRVAKWSYAIKFWSSQFLAWFIGLGMGIWGFALDGGWIRVITETGIAGSILFILFLKEASKVSPVMKVMVVSLCINMLMIDVHLSYKCMATFFFALGYFSDNRFLKYKLTA